MSSTTAVEAESAQMVADRLATLRELTFAAACALPESSSEKVLLGGNRHTLTVFRQTQSSTACLIVVQLSRPHWGGLVSSHLERGLVFATTGEVREANAAELTASGG